MLKIKVFKPIIAKISEKNLDTESCIVHRGLEGVVPFAEENVYEFTTVYQDADIIVCGENNINNSVEAKTEIRKFINQFSSNQLLVFISHLMHSGEGYGTFQNFSKVAEIFDNIFTQDDPEWIVLHTNSALKNSKMHPRVRYTDFMWNRHQTFYKYQPKCLFEDSILQDYHGCWYPEVTESKPTMSREIYNLSNLDEVCSLEFGETQSYDALYRLYISPNKSRGVKWLKSHLTGFDNNPPTPVKPEVRDFLRTELVELLRNWPGYLGDMVTGNVLMGNSNDPTHIYNNIAITGNLCWFPIHNAYYDHSILSIYTETITFSLYPLVGELVRASSDTDSPQVTIVTEKTLEPLIKGHFILPFGYKGLISELKSYGFKFPVWINYEYDTCTNDLQRWFEYNKEVKRVLNLGYEKLKHYKFQDKNILKHNRELFFNTGYKETVTDALITVDLEKINSKRYEIIVKKIKGLNHRG